MLSRSFLVLELLTIDSALYYFEFVLLIREDINSSVTRFFEKPKALLHKTVNEISRYDSIALATIPVFVGLWLGWRLQAGWLPFRRLHFVPR